MPLRKVNSGVDQRSLSLRERACFQPAEDVMVDPESRARAALLLRRFVSGRLTNDEFDEAYPDWSKDRGVRVVWEFAWSLYSDYYTHRLLGRYELSAETRRIAAQCFLFLHSGLEYAWPDPPRMRLGAELRQLFRLGLWRPGHSQAMEEWRRGIETHVWPFASAHDLHRAATVRPFFHPGIRAMRRET
jgi:hypothetical protein